MERHDTSIEPKSKFICADELLQRQKAIYKELLVNERCTRVLILHPAELKDEQISCSMEVMALLPDPSRHYKSLSYVWGPASVTEDIVVNGVPFAVTTNLASALRQIRNILGGIALWADAICINQSDIPERNQQVLLMRDIYSKAERVIGWLGPDDNGGSQALGNLDKLFQVVVPAPKNFAWVQRVSGLLQTNKTFPGTQVATFRSNDQLENLLLLLRRPFWTRMWIVQELVLPTHLTLMCGDVFMEIPEPRPFHAAIAVLSAMPMSGSPQWVTPFIWRRLAECMALLRMIARLRWIRGDRNHPSAHTWEGLSGFMNMRALLDQHLATDPRDHVYGLLGLLDLDVMPDYHENNDVLRVYLDLARRGLDLEFPETLSFAGIRNSEEQDDLVLPSWVPDWRRPHPARLRVWRYPQSHAFRCEGGQRPQVIEDKWLRMSGVVWDVVTRAESKAGWDLVEWDLVEPMNLDRPTDVAYPSGISRFQALIMLWLGGLDGTGVERQDLQLDSTLFRSYEIIFFANIRAKWRSKYGAEGEAQLFRHIFRQNPPLLNPAVPADHRQMYLIRSRQLRHGMRCFHTDCGYLGIAPSVVAVGDVVAVLEGHKAPVLLRPQGSYHLFVGDCDVVGIMNGEVLDAVSRGKAAITEIEIH